MFSELCMHPNYTTAEPEGGREKAPQSNRSHLARIPRKCNDAYELGSRQENVGKHPEILGDPVTALEHAMQKLARSPDWRTSKVHAGRRDKRGVLQVPRVLYRTECQGFFNLAKHMQISILKKIGR
jgi:hypothetical protein